MNKNLEELKKVNKEYVDTSAKLEIALCYIIPILEDFEKKLIQLEKKTIKVVDENFSKGLKKVVHKIYERK